MKGGAHIRARWLQCYNCVRKCGRQLGLWIESFLLQLAEERDSEHSAFLATEGSSAPALESSLKQSGKNKILSHENLGNKGEAAVLWFFGSCF